MKRLGSAIILGALLLSLVGCMSWERVRVSSDPISHVAETRYEYEKAPVVIENLSTDNKKTTFTYQRPPKRVIAVWQNSIETLLALGVGDRIVAAMGLPDRKYLREEYRAQYDKIHYTGLELLDLETIMMMEPDFILGWYSTFQGKSLRSTDFWQHRGVNTYIATSSAPAPMEFNSQMQPIRGRHRLQEEMDYIRDLGRIFDRSVKAEELVGEMQREIQVAQEQTAHLSKRPRALIMEFLGKEISVYGERTLAGNMLQSLGGELLEPDVDRMSLEQIVDLNPDVIFLVVTEQHYDNADIFVKRIYNTPALQHLPCVQAHRVYVVPLYTVYAPGVRALDGLKIFSRGLYPDLHPQHEG